MTTTEMTPAERRFVALARDKALSFFAANPTVRPASGFGVSFTRKVCELADNRPAGPCACLLTPMLLLREAVDFDGALTQLSEEHLVSREFLADLVFGWDSKESTLRQFYARHRGFEALAAASAIRREIEKMRGET